MANTLNPAISKSFDLVTNNESVASRFLAWCEREEKERLLWVGLSLGLHGCIITPMAFLAVVVSGNNFPLLTLTILSIVIILVANLAAMPTKISIPLFIATFIIDFAIITACVLSGFNI